MRSNPGVSRNDLVSRVIVDINCVLNLLHAGLLLKVVITRYSPGPFESAGKSTS